MHVCIQLHFCLIRFIQVSLVLQLSNIYGFLSFLQNGNWVDRVCDEKHDFICMKKSAAEPSGDEVEQNIGCKVVRKLCLF